MTLIGIDHTDKEDTLLISIGKQFGPAPYVYFIQWGAEKNCYILKSRNKKGETLEFYKFFKNDKEAIQTVKPILRLFLGIDI